MKMHLSKSDWEFHEYEPKWDEVIVGHVVFLSSTNQVYTVTEKNEKMLVLER